MVTESMTPSDEIIEDDDLAEEPSGDVGEDEVLDDLGTLRAEIDTLKEQLKRPAWLNELKTIEGRVRSTAARLQQSDDPNKQQALRAELERRIGESNTLIHAMLNNMEDSAFTNPDVKRQAQAYLDQQQEAAKEAQLLQKVRDSVRAEQPQAAPDTSGEWSPEVRVWERTRVRQIQNAGLDPDSEDWAPVWQAAAQSLVQSDFDTADDVIDAHIASSLSERANAIDRNEKKTRAKASPAASGGTKGSLDLSRPSSERIAYLRSIGAI